MLLTGGAVAVVAMGVYLVLEVRTPPAAAHVPTGLAPSSDDPDRPEDRRAGGPGDIPPVGSGRANPAPPRTPGPRTDVSAAPADPADPESTPAPNLPLDHKPPSREQLMTAANQAYDHSEFEDARALALKVVANDPKNARMLRILVSVACMEGDPAEAQKHFALLAERDRKDMRIRCERYSVTFAE